MTRLRIVSLFATLLLTSLHTVNSRAQEPAPQPAVGRDNDRSATLQHPRRDARSCSTGNRLSSLRVWGCGEVGVAGWLVFVRILSTKRSSLVLPRLRVWGVEGCGAVWGCRRC